MAPDDEAPSDDRLTLAGDFPPATAEQWRSLVDGVLAKGQQDPTSEDLARRFEKVLVSHTDDDIALQPLYDGNGGQGAVGNGPAGWVPRNVSGFPGLAPFVRGRTPLGATVGGWDVCQRVEVIDDGAAAGPIALAELEGGASSLWLGFGGAPSIDVDVLDRALAGVYLDLVSVRLDAGARFSDAAAALVALWQRRAIAPGDVRASLGMDPIGVAAARGTAGPAVDDAIHQTVDWARTCHADWPGVRAVTVDATRYHRAGASEGEELGCSLATGVAYLRALTSAGIPVDAAWTQLEVSYAATADQFLTIAKLRAARRLWSRVGEVIGADARHRVPPQHAVTSQAMLSAYDPWVNLLRTTVACFAAGLGGADSVTVFPYDEVSAGPASSSRGRRLARNIQALLLDESHLSRVIDPAGGSWYVESLTDELARAGWAWFQEIEASGGMVAALAGGVIQDRLAATWDKRAHRLATAADPLTGVSEFPNIDEAPPIVPLPAPRSSESSGPGLPVRRYAAAYEQQRGRADRRVLDGGARPEIFLACLGMPSVYTGRATFAKNFFEAAGIRAIGNDRAVIPDAVAEAFSVGGAKLACICSDDATYLELAAGTARALKEAGAERVYLAGRPGDHGDEWEAAGIDEFVYGGCDRLDVLTRALDSVGVQ